jgi:hypothetical protein
MFFLPAPNAFKAEDHAVFAKRSVDAFSGGRHVEVAQIGTAKGGASGVLTSNGVAGKQRAVLRVSVNATRTPKGDTKVAICINNRTIGGEIGLV